MANRIELHSQTKAFFLLVRANEKIRPAHIGLYSYLLHINNLNFWAEWFKCPWETVMRDCNINSSNTYYSMLKDLESWNLIERHKGVNLYQAPKIRIIPLVGVNNVPQKEKVANEAQ